MCRKLKFWLNRAVFRLCYVLHYVLHYVSQVLLCAATFSKKSKFTHFMCCIFDLCVALCAAFFTYVLHYVLHYVSFNI